MKVIDPGHYYALNVLDKDPAFAEAYELLHFVKREGPGYPGNVGHHPGTNIQEVIRALIDRVQYLDRQIPDFRNTMIIASLRQVIRCLEWRAAERHGRTDPVPMGEIELLPTCPECGHIGCLFERCRP